MNNQTPTNETPLQETPATSASTETPVSPAPEEKKSSAKKPVITYIMILFIAAFLLMALSFAMHQRSNQEALGKLETSFNATIVEIQETQEQILELERQLDEANDLLETVQIQLDETTANLEKANLQQEATEALYVLQQKYAYGLYQECVTLAEQMESTGLTAALSPNPITTETGASVTAPYSRYLQLKEAASAKLGLTSTN